jgi:hypothetical protein
MSWDRDPLWAKARLFFQNAFNTRRDDPQFGLLCSFGLELLARSAVASVSPVLLALPDNEHKNLLHVVHKESQLPFPQSISVTLVFKLCKRMFADFSEDDNTIALALLNRRNAELHSGAAAFEEYKSSQWLAGFYHACRSLTAVLKVSLTDLFGEQEAKLAEEMLAENRDNIKREVLSAIAAHKRVFDAKQPAEQEAAKLEAEELGQTLSTQRHHRVKCPACGCTATVQGRLFGKEHVTHEENGDIIVRQAVIPTDFSCIACGLKLLSYAQLETAGLGDHYTRKTTYSPEEYYGLINPDDIDEYLEERAGDLREYDNE